ncbi:MAG: tetratricopeptide (TPR) repeat protein [Zhongshania sp.]|jgi:tetratricopeptide (TPR) repeat protein
MSLTSPKYFAALTITIAAMSPYSVFASTAADDAFKQGVVSSKAGYYAQAIERFLQAKKAGKTSAILYHNLGVAYFKQGRYPEALTAFEEASRSEKLASLSYYNMGLVEEKRGNQTDAAKWFERSRNIATTETLRRLAERKLGLRDSAIVPYIAYLEAFVGNDSNPQLVDETSNLAVERDGDNFLGTLLYGRYHFGGDANQGGYISGTGYIRRYADVNDEDATNLGLGAGYIQLLRSWRLDYQLNANQLAIGGDAIQSSINAVLNAQYSLPSAYIDTRIALETVNGDDGNGYDYLSGERMQLRLRYNDTLASLRWRVGYELNVNDRNQLITTDSTGAISERFSASPLQNTFSLHTSLPLTTNLTAEFSGDYRISRYDEQEIRAGALEAERGDKRWSTQVDVRYQLSRGWSTRLEATHWNNDSNFDAYSYQRNEITLAVSKTFN